MSTTILRRHGVIQTCVLRNTYWTVGTIASKIAYRLQHILQSLSIFFISCIQAFHKTCRSRNELLPNAKPQTCFVAPLRLFFVCLQNNTRECNIHFNSLFPGFVDEGASPRRSNLTKSISRFRVRDGGSFGTWLAHLGAVKLNWPPAK